MSETSVILDRSGVPFYYGDGGVLWFPPFPLPYSYKHQIDVIKNTVIRDDDIILTGYGKSGNSMSMASLSVSVSVSLCLCLSVLYKISIDCFCFLFRY